MNTKLTISTRNVFTVLACALFSFALLQGSAVAGQLTAKANHDHISIGTFYHGSTVSVRGTYEPGTDLIIKITAPDGKTALKEKGKTAGFLWMNIDELEFENTPGLYFIRSSQNIDKLVDSQDANKYVLGFTALEHHIGIDKVNNQEEKARWFAEFVKFKEQQKLYAEGGGEITYSNKDGKHTYYTLFDWPYQAQPGDYTVDVYAVKDGRVVDSAQSMVLVDQAGAVKFLATMAKSNGAMYGIISIVIALLTGFGTGIIFKSGGGAH